MAKSLIQLILILVSATFGLAQNNKETNIYSKVGIVDGSIEKICLRTKNGNLTENTSVSIVTSLEESKQKILSAKIKKKLYASCSRHFSESTDKNPGKDFYYLLVLTEKAVDEFQEVFGIGVIKPKNSFKFQNNKASIDLNNDGRTEFFRQCEGFEGALFAIWTGNPLKGKRIWNSFYYVDYDTEKNCTKRELRNN
ncbi:MAG TPA: hypothetical protein PKY82_30830 [Pyrinomonadaceae bacterium]|nr:hypothetical protein [Pyrinomonadaceae bacterium]